MSNLQVVFKGYVVKNGLPDAAAWCFHALSMVRWIPSGWFLTRSYWGGPVGETNFWIGFRTPFWGHPQEPVLLEGSKWHLAFLKQGLP